MILLRTGCRLAPVLGRQAKAFMPFDVSGIVEATWSPVAEHGAESQWWPVLFLDLFTLRGDEVSDYLFGLAKRPALSACFPNRGLPQDSTEVVRRLAEENDAFIARYGEGDFGHSYAHLDEIDAALASPSAPPLGDSEWRDVFETIKAFQRIRPLPPEQWRLVVWADW